jgi:hypothetical protein
MVRVVPFNGLGTVESISFVLERERGPAQFHASVDVVTGKVRDARTRYGSLK